MPDPPRHAIADLMRKAGARLQVVDLVRASRIDERRNRIFVAAAVDVQVGAQFQLSVRLRENCGAVLQPARILRTDVVGSVVTHPDAVETTPARSRQDSMSQAGSGNQACSCSGVGIARPLATLRASMTPMH